MDINSLVVRSPSSSTRSPGNVSANSRDSDGSRVRDDRASSVRTSSATTSSTPAPLPKLPAELYQQQYQPNHAPAQSGPQYHQQYAPPPAPAQYPVMNAYPPYQPHHVQDPRYPPPGQIPLARGPLPTGSTNKRLAPAQPHPAESPAKKKQSKWSTDEDAEIIRLRGNGMKWEDISKQLPGRSAISCRLRFQNYLERRSEWDEERKNKLARFYERYDASFSRFLGSSTYSC